MKLLPKRENLMVAIDGQDTSVDYLTIYDKFGNILARSTDHHFLSEIRVTYDEVEYVALPHTGEILVTYKSLEQKFAPK